MQIIIYYVIITRTIDIKLRGSGLVFSNKKMYLVISILVILMCGCSDTPNIQKEIPNLEGELFDLKFEIPVAKLKSNERVPIKTSLQNLTDEKITIEHAAVMAFIYVYDLKGNVVKINPDTILSIAVEKTINPSEIYEPGTELPPDEQRSISLSGTGEYILQAKSELRLKGIIENKYIPYTVVSKPILVEVY
ncbi:hypothetical protein WMW72_02385 [Paenibacillus filicis]|uniref:Intracellular proteinase inhibitor BsuPI domain-containing protein n=1 Tax=Paenibacillus filicis TaxID=669464 RepID=A0ABU9DG74_9BACL